MSPKTSGKTFFVKASDSMLVEFYVTKSIGFTKTSQTKEIGTPQSPLYFSGIYTFKMLYNFFCNVEVNQQKAFLGLLLNASHSARQQRT